MEIIQSNVKGKNNPAYGRKLYNNGIINFFGFECPTSFKAGMLRKN